MFGNKPITLEALMAELSQVGQMPQTPQNAQPRPTSIWDMLHPGATPGSGPNTVAGVFGRGGTNKGGAASIPGLKNKNGVEDI